MSIGPSPSSRPWTRRARAAAFALVVSAPFAAGPAAGPARAAEGASAHSFDVVLAPVCLEGDFGVTIDIGDGGDIGEAGPLVGTFRLGTDVRGRVSGTLDLGLRTFDVTGNVSYGPKGTRATFTAKSGKDRIAFSGAVEGQTLVGRATGHGAVAAGKHDFAVNVANAGPLVATLECAISESAKGKITGTAHVVACGDTVDLKVSGKRTSKRVTLALASGGRFSFSGRGAPDGIDLVVDWSAKGFGATAKGDDVLVAPLAPPVAPVYAAAFHELETVDPIVPIAPTAGEAPRGGFTIAPALPAGLRFDASTGTISGTATELRDTTTYTVTAANFAGSESFTLQIRTRVPRATSFATETRALTDDDLRHFLVRTQFAATKPEMDEIRAVGLGAYIDSTLVFSQNTAADAIAAPELVNASDPVGLEGMFPSSTQLGRWWSSLMMNNASNPFQERLAFFWHDHFAASSDILEGGETYFMVRYVNLFRHHGNGNLRDLLVNVARDPCMLKYLDGYRNTATRPNENFGREFWELFTLGVDNGYTQADIVEGARAFTGYKRVTDPVTGLVTMVFDTKLHDSKAKTVLGATIDAQNLTDDYEAMVDLTLARRPVAEFITRKLFEHFCYESPPDALVTEMADHLRAENYELSPFLKRLVSSEAFFAPKTRKSLVKNPVEFSMGFIHATGLKIRVSSLGNQLNTLGQFPTQPPTVNGWPLGDLWLSSQNMADRINLAYLCVEDTTNQRAAGIEVANILPPVPERTPANVVDTASTLLRVDLSAAERQSCIDYLNTTRSSNGTINQVPFDGANQAHLDERVRGLLWNLAQHPTSQIR